MSVSSGRVSLDRRSVFGALAAFAAIAAYPLIAVAQTGKTYRVAAVSIAGKPLADRFMNAFRDGLREYGYVVGRNLIFDVRYADGDASRLPALVDELIALKPDVLAGSEATVQIMKSRTSSLPIVLFVSSDPVGLGLAQSLARPGGNVTGVSTQSELIAPKHIEIMREILPRLSRIGLFVDPSAPGWKAGEENARKAARAAGLDAVVYYVQSRGDIEAAFAKMEKDRPDALTMGNLSNVTFQFREVVFDNALRLRIPVSVPSAMPDARSLFAFGPDGLQAFHDAARYVDRILRGAKPGDLPIEQPTKFEMVVNLKTARALGLTIPQSVLLRADRVIE